MKRFIILLRGINVSGKNKIPMLDLRELLNSLGFQNVKTYIQSGNIILESSKTKSATCNTIRDAIKDKFGFNVPVIARTIPEWKKAIENYPFSTENEKIVAFTFLDKASEITEIEINNIGEDKYKINGDVVYLNCPSTFAKTKLTNNSIEKKLKVTATTRNLRTTLKLLELSKDLTGF
ncbi:hypothetical protein BW723_00755 [Polaribacter reichenbachii]|uniref:DUF1697 domain-containing protein n=1 Tax=Polaribacter reichenbachii TaxID=996801 RepID=A0A1B8TRV8_9FLAO|nr:DUF1697 domain-containing protein [Polaribacter reichenbachii]APZ44903.1 hypothetical protein BW723_00755 [Polaribacter reichenbachii]AUC18767.1 hypothetical protein BTO17_08760 [Polaribacter reichenbachii]OBY62403.1 hypothetical protein LPB301_14935 [Polaribacter reichenbachii]